MDLCRSFHESVNKYILHISRYSKQIALAWLDLLHLININHLSLVTTESSYVSTDMIIIQNIILASLQIADTMEFNFKLYYFLSLVDSSCEIILVFLLDTEVYFYVNIKSFIILLKMSL